MRKGEDMEEERSRLGSGGRRVVKGRSHRACLEIIKRTVITWRWGDGKNLLYPPLPAQGKHVSHMPGSRLASFRPLMRE